MGGIRLKMSRQQGNQKNKPSIVAVIGATGSGKSHYVKKVLKKIKGRILIWDFKNEYSAEGFTATTSLGDVSRALRGSKNARVAFLPSMDDKIRAREFDQCCEFVYALGDLTFLVEELKFVTRPNWSPMAWSKITMSGRDLGIRVVGTSQRPASIDKDFFGNCTLVRCGALGYDDDIVVMAKSMRLDRKQIEKLTEYQFLQYRR